MVLFKRRFDLCQLLIASLRWSASIRPKCHESVKNLKSTTLPTMSHTLAKLSTARVTLARAKRKVAVAPEGAREVTRGRTEATLTMTRIMTATSPTARGIRISRARESGTGVAAGWDFPWSQSRDFGIFIPEISQIWKSPYPVIFFWDRDRFLWDIPGFSKNF